MFKLAIINLQRTKIRTILTGATIVIGICSLFLILSLNAGISRTVFSSAEKNNPLNQITIHPPSSNNIITSLLGVTRESPINDETIAELSKLPNIKEVYSETAYLSPSAIEVNMFGQKLQTDGLIFGVPYSFVSDSIKSESDWTPTNQPYPAIVSRKLLDIYNLSVAQPQSLPQVTEEMIIGQEIDIYLGYSSFFIPFSKKEDAPRIRAKITGFSDKTNLVGVTLPEQLVQNLNKEKDPTYQNQYINLYAIADSPENVEKIAHNIEENFDLETTYLQKTYSQIQSNIIYLSLGLALISIIILTVSALSIANSFFANINERVNEIGILRSIGADQRSIATLFLTEAGLLGLINGLIGVILAITLIPIINSTTLSFIPDISTKPTNLFHISLLTAAGMPIFSLIFSLIAAYIPSRTAANMNTIEALNK